jgi:hypothetical protein
MILYRLAWYTLMIAVGAVTWVLIIAGVLRLVTP